MPFGFGRAFGFTYYTFTFYQFYIYLIYLFSYIPSLLSALLYCTPLYNLSLKLWQLLGFCLLAVLPYCRSSPSCIVLLFSIIVFNSINNSINSSPVSFSIFPVSFGPPVISHSSITWSRSGLLLSFYIAYSIFFLPLLFPCFGLVSTSESC